MKRSISLLFALVFTAMSALAQQFKVEGNVKVASDGEALIGVAVKVDGQPIGAVTDINGNYTITVDGLEEAILVFSYLGMKPQRHKVNATTHTLNVILEEESQELNELVVVAYGVRKKGTITGSVSSVKAEKIENVPAASFDQALQGQATGLLVTSQSGEPSKAASFQIRGTNSINSGTSPLFILDGVPISANDFNAINPADIESVSVLKDASSTSIYGARAANGVVVIQTKRGTAVNKAQVTLRTQWGISQLARTEWHLMNTQERIAFEKEIGMDQGKDYERLSLVDVNWMDMVFRNNALLQNYDVSVNHATDKLNYFVSANFYDQEGIAQNSEFTRYNIRANVDVKAAKWLKLGSNIMLAYEDYAQADDGEYALYTPISASRFMLPYWNPFRADGSIASASDGSWKGTSQNPIEWMDNNPLTNKKYKLMSVFYAEATPMEGLTLKTQFGADFSHGASVMKSMPSYIINNGSGSVGRSSSDMLNLTITNTANYLFDIDHTHNFNILIGQEGVHYRSEGFQAVTRGQNNDKLTNLSSGTRAVSWHDYYSSNAYLSFFGRGEYNYAGRYYADFSLRTDASSRFGKKNRWATFWSLGLMWDARKESMLSDVNWLSNAQVALSSGTSGNSTIPDYDHLALVGGGETYMDIAAIAPWSSGNENLGWEQTWTTNLAIHLGFWHRLNLDLEFYNKRTTNMLMYVPCSYADKGEGYRWDNIGAMVNRGAELQVSVDVVRAKDWNWRLNANISYNHNEIAELYGGVNEYELSSTSLRLEVGHPYGEYFLNRYAGVNPANGDALWYTKDGEITNVFNEEDKVMLGKSFNAPWQGGFGSQLTWRDLTLSLHFSWMGDRWIFNNDRFFEESNGLYSVYNQSRRLLYDRWKQPGDITDIPRYGVTPQMDSRFLENASFLRLKNVSLSYNVPQQWLRKTKTLKQVRLYVQAQNLFTFTRFTGIDPEAVGNIYRAQYPMTRQWTGGLEVTF